MKCTMHWWCFWYLLLLYQNILHPSVLLTVTVLSTTCSRLLPEKLIATQLVNKLPASEGTWRFIKRVHMSPTSGHQVRWFQYVASHCLRYIWVLSCYWCLDLFRFLNQTTVCVSYLLVHAPCSLYPLAFTGQTGKHCSSTLHVLSLWRGKHYHALPWYLKNVLHL